MAILSEKEAWEKIDLFERQSDALNILVDGWPAWQLLRFTVASKMQKLNWQKPPASRKDLIAALIRGLNFWNIQRREYIVHSLYSGARNKSDKGYSDIWFEDLLDNVPGGGKLIRYNAPGYSDRQSKLKTPYDYDTTLLIYLSSLFARIFPVKDIDGGALRIAEAAGAHLALPFITEKFVLKRVSITYWQKRMYKILLAAIRPKAVFVIDTTEFSLLSACKDLGIKLIELQHGIFTRHHPRSLRPSYASSETILYPSVLGVYGEFWKRELHDTAIGKKGLIEVVGNPLLEKYRKQREGREVQTQRSIVITTQPFDLSSMCEFFKEFLSLSHENIKIIFKLHPASGSATGLLHELKDPRVEIRSGLQEPNTYQLIAESDYHLSVASACHYDALAIGTPTIILALEGHELMLNLHEKGAASLVKTPQDLLNLLKEGSKTPVNPDDFCKPGFCETMKKLI